MASQALGETAGTFFPTQREAHFNNVIEKQVLHRYSHQTNVRGVYQWGGIQRRLEFGHMVYMLESVCCARMMCQLCMNHVCVFDCRSCACVIVRK